MLGVVSASGSTLLSIACKSSAQVATPIAIPTCSLTDYLAFFPINVMAKYRKLLLAAVVTASMLRVAVPGWVLAEGRLHRTSLSAAYRTGLTGSC